MTAGPIRSSVRSGSVGRSLELDLIHHERHLPRAVAPGALLGNGNQPRGLVIGEVQELAPVIVEEPLEFCGRGVPETDPHHLRRRTLEQDALREILVDTMV